MSATQDAEEGSGGVGESDATPTHRDPGGGTPVAAPPPSSDVVGHQGCPIHSVSIAHFDISIGNTISHTWPPEVDLKKEVVQTNLHDMCFPDGAHDTNRDTVYAVCDKPGGGHLYIVGCYRALKCEGVKRGAVQRGILIITHTPLFGTLSEFTHNLLRWWLCAGGNRENPLNPATFSQNNLQASFSRRTRPGSPRSPDSKSVPKDWVDVASQQRQHGWLEGTPRDPTPEQDVAFLKTVYECFEKGFSAAKDGDRHRIIPVQFRTQVEVAGKKEHVMYETELTAPIPTASISDQLSFGCSISTLIRIFKHDAAKIYTALLHHRTLCFVGGTAEAVATCVLACCHMVRPVTLLPTEVTPYFTVTDPSRIEQQPFCVAGSTNPFYEDPGRNRWSTAICNVSTGAVTLTSNKPEGSETLPLGATGGLPTVTKQAQRLVAHVTEGVLQDNRTEAWVRNFFEWSNAKILSNLLQEKKALPLLARPVGRAGDSGEVGERVSLTSETLQKSIEAAEAITVTMTKCHEANRTKTKIHSDWFSTILDVLRPVCARSGEEQGEMFEQIAGCCLDDALRGFRDITVDACGSRTERAAIAQLAYEESKTRLLVTELRERIHLLLDSINSQRNRRAFDHEENQLFCDTFNTPDYQFYNLQAQVLLHSANCMVVNRTYVAGSESPSTAGLGDSARHIDINSSFAFSETPTSRVTRCSGKVFISKNYLCFAAGWQLRVGKSSGGDRRNMSPIEIIPFDVIEKVRCESSGAPDGIHLKLASDSNLSVNLHLSSLSDSYKLLTLLETLSEKQKRTHLLLGALDPVLNVPNIADQPVRSPVGVERRIHIPCGMYLHERLVTEEVYELNRFYPVVGWRSALMPHDPPSCCDRSGKYERRFTGRHSVTLPDGWVWLAEWSPSHWEYNTDFKSKPAGWKQTHSKLDICRRRRWTRVRRLEHDALGTPLPTMMLPSDYPIAEEHRRASEGAHHQEESRGEMPDQSDNAPASPSLLEPESPLGSGVSKKGSGLSDEACCDDDTEGGCPSEAEASTAVHPFASGSPGGSGGDDVEAESSAGSPQAVSASVAGGQCGGSMTPPREASAVPAASGSATPVRPSNAAPSDSMRQVELGMSPAVGSATTPQTVPAEVGGNPSLNSMGNASFTGAAGGGGTALGVRCRQSVKLGPAPERKALSPEAFDPDTVLPKCGVSELGLKDFDRPAGRFSPFHTSSAMPGCGAQRYGTELPGNPTAERVPVDALIAEAKGLPVASGTSGSSVGSPCGQHGSPLPGQDGVLAGTVGSVHSTDEVLAKLDAPPPPRRKSGVQKFKEDFKQDLKELKQTLKSDLAVVEEGQVSKGVVLVDADADGNPIPPLNAASTCPFSAGYTEESDEAAADDDKRKSRKLRGLRSFIDKSKRRSRSWSKGGDDGECVLKEHVEPGI